MCTYKLDLLSVSLSLSLSLLFSIHIQLVCGLLMLESCKVSYVDKEEKKVILADEDYNEVATVQHHEGK